MVGRIMGQDAENAEGGRVASGQAMKRESVRGFPVPSLSWRSACRILSCFVVFCRPLWARAGEGAGGRLKAADGRRRRLSAITCDDLMLSKFEISGKVICRKHRNSREQKRTEGTETGSWERVWPS